MDADEKFWRAYFPTAFAEGDRYVPIAQKIAHPDAFDAERIRQWIRSAAEMIDTTPTQWAKAAGLAASTINRFLRDRGAANLSARTLEALVKAHGDIYTERALAFVTDNERLRISFNIDVIGSILSETRKVFEWENDMDYRVTVPVPKFFAYPMTFGFEIGEDIDEIYAAGDIVIGNPFAPFRQHLINNQSLLVHERKENNEVVSSIKRLIIDPNDEMWLVRRGKSSKTQAIYLGDLNERGFSQRHLVSFVLFGRIACETGVTWSGSNFALDDSSD